MRAGRGLASWKFRMMRIVASGTRLEGHWAYGGVPIPACAAMHSGFPIPIGGTMTTPAQRRAVGDAQLVSVPALQSIELGFVMAVEAVVVAAMRPMAHHNVLMFAR